MPQICPLYYERIADICVRISSIALNWQEAENQCKYEGGHLLSITKSQIQLELRDLVQQKIVSDVSFFPPYSFETENYWIGGTIRVLNDWRWISTLSNFSSFNSWAGGKEGYGCPSSTGCLHNQALKVSGVQLTWMAEDRSFMLPFICQSSCSIGYIWHKRARKCVKIVKTEKISASKASLACSKEKGRLLSVNSCQELRYLKDDLKNFGLSNGEKFWIGNHSPQSTIDNCLTGNGLQMFYTLLLTNNYNPAQLSKVHKDDTSDDEMYLCEKENIWSCPRGYMMHGEHCYKMPGLLKSSGEAELFCLKEDANMLTLDNFISFNFLSAWLLDMFNSPSSIFLGYRRHTNTMSATEDNVYTSFDGLSVLDTSLFGLPGSGEGDCLVLEKSSSTFNLNHVHCNSLHNFVCMKPQTEDESQLWPLENYTQLILPLDVETKFSPYDIEDKNIKENQVSLLDTLSPSGLRGTAGFLRSLPSFLVIPSSFKMYMTFGVTILVWVKLNHPLMNRKKLIIFEASSSSDNNFKLFIFKENNILLLGSQLCSQRAESEVDICQVFKSHKNMKIFANTWTYLGFSYSTDNNQGTFFVNKIYGTSLGQKTYFHISTYDWFDYAGAIRGPVTIGSNSDRTLSFGGEMSCLQVYEHAADPAQAQHLQKCPVHYNRNLHCPEGFFYYNQRCFKLSEKKEEFSSAESICSNDPEYTSRLFYPQNYKIKDHIITKLKIDLNEGEIWMGLDKMSDNQEWIKSDGTIEREISWSEGSNNSTDIPLCAFINVNNNG